MHFQLSSEFYLKFICMLAVWNLRTRSPVVVMRLREGKGLASEYTANCSRVGTRIRTLLFQ